MKKVMTTIALFTIILGLNFSASAQDIVVTQELDAGRPGSPGYTEKKDELRSMTQTNRSRNATYDEWKYLTDLKAAFEQEIEATQFNQTMVKQLVSYCASDTDSYTCKNEDLIISVDTRMSSAVKDWQNAVIVILEIEDSRNGGVPGNSVAQERARINILMNDIDRLNERAKEDYNLAATEMVEFQEQNPLLFTSPEN